MERKWEGCHLWFYVRALGFKHKAVGASRLVLGEEMFNMPNPGAFRVIATFLFRKLDPLRAAMTFRNCGSAHSCFARWCFIWMKDIEKKHRGHLRHVLASSLISAGGPAFVHMFYLFTKYVLVEDMKRCFVGTGRLVAKAVKSRRRNMYVAKARCRVAYNKLLQIFLKEHFLIQEYKKKARLLIEDKARINAEYAVLEIQSRKMKQSTENKNDKTERIQKIRSMWMLIMGMLTSLKKEKEVVDSFLDVREDGVILDGTKVVVSVPRFLSYRVENDVYKRFTGNANEAKSLNFLAVIQVLNEALRTLRDEHFQSELEKYLCVFENRRTCHRNSLQGLKVMRQKIEQQQRVSSVSVFRGQEDWKEKWKSFLGLSPFYFILNQNQVNSFRQNLINRRERVKELTVFQHHSSRVAEVDRVFCQRLLSISDMLDSITEESCRKDDGVLETTMDKSPPRISSLALEMSKASEYRDLLTEPDLPIETCKVEEKPLSQDMLRNGKDESAISETGENAGYPVENLLEKARDELAEEVAEAVVSESSPTGERKGMALEDHVSSLCFDPFITRREIPRTPENLLTEVRRPWRKAIQTEDSSDIKLNVPEVTIEEAPVDAYTCKMADSRSECFDPASSVPDFDPALSESKSQLSCAEFRPQKQMRISHIESPVSESSGIQESERTEAQGLKYIVLNNSSVDDLEGHTSPYVKSIMNTTGACSENTCGMNVLPSDRFQGSLMGRMLHWNVSSLLNAVSGETACLGILGETLEGCLEGEELCSIDTNQSASFESDFVVMDSSYVTDGSKNEEGIERSKLDVQSLFNLHKALEKMPSTSEKELHQILDEGESGSSVSSPSLAPEKRGIDEFSSPQELFCLDEEFTKTPSPESFNEIKRSLSSLLASLKHLEEMASMINEIPSDLKQKLKDKEHLDEKPAMKEPSSR